MDGCTRAAARPGSLLDELMDGRWRAVRRVRLDGRWYVAMVERRGEGLDARRRDLVARIAAGETHQEIAYAWSVGASTVSYHANAALAWLGLLRLDLPFWGFGALHARRWGTDAGGSPRVLVASPRFSEVTLPELTPAEREVAALSLMSLDNAAIAAKRGVSVRTVANQLAGVYRKLGGSSRLDLAVAVARRVAG
ncbi:MAG TPA: helix-turn-helix transcriptional regulator [Sandaracinaceae bacterium LLY-WYZ-13_1]|nr:helix-turn-helix transcriptional regulator [Sandaracinaceae bacterium LLY-WYZ-13_1]